MKITFALLSSLLLSACVSVPPTTPQNKEIAARTLGLSAQPAPTYSDQWWTAFHDPQVNRLAELALKNSPTLQKALARIRGAQSQLSGARADDRPQVNLQGQEQRLLFSKNYIIPPPYGGVTMQRPPRWMRRRRGWRCRVRWPRPISICCSPIRISTLPTRSCRSARKS